MLFGVKVSSILLVMFFLLCDVWILLSSGISMIGML